MGEWTLDKQPLPAVDPIWVCQ